jgi:SAM-dependent methyltransferase
MTEKFILDATAGNRMMWFNKTHPNTLYIDIRPEVAPDIVMDWRRLDIEDNSKTLIVFDPPHMKRPAGNQATGLITKTFGALTIDSWESDIQKGFKELWRVLKPGGILIFKWNDHDINIERIKPFFPTAPLFGQITKGSTRCPYNQVCKAKVKSKSRSSITYWFTFMKIPEVASNNRKETEVEK